jgi:hypothetical protein
VMKFIGYYISDEGLPFSFDMKNNQLFYHINDETNFLIKDTADTFSIPKSPGVKFVFSIKAKDTIVNVFTPDQIYCLKKYINSVSQTDKVLKTYTGVYYCPELDCKYGIVLKDHQLMLTNSKYNDVKLNLIGTDHLTDEYWWMNHLMVERDSKNKITGFEVNSGRIMHLKFNKIE